MQASCLDHLIWIALAIAIAVVGAATTRLAKGDTGKKCTDLLKARMGLPKWDFSNSWASMFTGAGAIANSILSAQLATQSAEPARTHSGPAYATVAVIFGAFVIIASLRRPPARGSQPVGPPLPSVSSQGPNSRVSANLGAS